MGKKTPLLKEEKKISPAEALRQERWSNGLTCIYCLSQEVNKNGVRSDNIQQYRCRKCGKSFNDRTETIFSKTQMSIGECFKIIEQHNKDKNIKEISEKIDRSWKTVNDFIKRLEQSLVSEKLSELLKESKDSEIDYSKVGCGNALDF